MLRRSAEERAFPEELDSIVDGFPPFRREISEMILP